MELRTGRRPAFGACFGRTIPIFVSGADQRLRALLTEERTAHASTKKPARVSSSGFEKESGGDLLSHRGHSAVPSALEGLTSEFGMRSGGAPPVKPPEIAKMVKPEFEVGLRS